MGAIFCPGCRSHITAEEPTCGVCGLQRPPPGWPVDEQIGRVVHGKYRVDKRLSAGGFGTVFLAMQVHGGIEMGRVILKFLHREHAQDPGVTKRFLNEVKTARELINPHIVRVFDLGYDHDGTPFMVQEFIEGEGLEGVLQREKRLPPPRALKLAMQVAEGMAEAHGKGIIHRDLKPENLRIQDGTGLVKILDFGIARISTTRGTATNSFVGTPRYMPPEQIKQQQLDSGVDIFALGVILFEMLAGEPPIPNEGSELEYIHLNLIQEPRRLIELLQDCPRELSDFVYSMMTKTRADRPADMDAVVRALDELAARFGWAEDSTSRFRLSGAATGVRRTVAQPTRDRTPSPSATGPVADEEIVELVPAAPRRTGLWIGLAGGGIGLVAILLALVLAGRGGSEQSGRTPPAADAGGTAAAAEAALPDAEAVATAAADAGDATARESGPDVATPDVPTPDAASAEPDTAPTEVVDVPTEETAPVDAAPPPDRAVTDAGSAVRRDRAVRRDAGSARDTGTSSPRDARTRTDGSNPFTKIRSTDAGSQFNRVGS
ncbi:MAG: serine/threonine protein kinase [Deltaproteobacteria bacterium]|nr:serine/threonine protein kinase [Deltaproteobacteria bacterium]